MRQEVENLKQAIKAVIKKNGNEEITGEILQQVLVNIADLIGDNYPISTKNLSLVFRDAIVKAGEQGEINIGDTAFSHKTLGIEPDADAEVDMGATKQFNQIYSYEFLENGQMLVDKYAGKSVEQEIITKASKKEAYDFVNLDFCASLRDAIQKIPQDLRMRNQVVTFVNEDNATNKKVTLWMDRVSAGMEIQVYFGDVPAASIFYNTSDDVVETNRELYNHLIADSRLKGFIDLPESYINEGYEMIVLNMTRRFGNADIRFVALNDKAFNVNQKTLQEYQDASIDSYQYNGTSLGESTFLNEDNWVKVLSSQRLEWGTF